jgi:hypothetical protein
LHQLFDDVAVAFFFAIATVAALFVPASHLLVP